MRLLGSFRRFRTSEGKGIYRENGEENGSWYLGRRLGEKGGNIGIMEEKMEASMLALGIRV